MILTPSANKPLVFTGERMVPESATSSDFWDHIYRYRFAAQFVKGKRVLDIACGEGYGTAALSKAGADSVIGVDISQEDCDHARAKYGIDARFGRAEDIPLKNDSVDVLVSFETIEHVPAPEQFLDECFRVLRKGGLLIISTPDKDVYSEAGHHNHYHCSEMTEEEFLGKLTSQFSVDDVYKQHIKSTSWRSLKNLAADIPWSGLKGVTGLVYRSRKLFFTKVSDAKTTQYRLNVLNAMKVTDGLFSSLFNPYLLRKAGPAEKEKAYYLIVVAHKS